MSVSFSGDIEAGLVPEKDIQGAGLGAFTGAVMGRCRSMLIDVNRESLLQ